MGEFIAAAFMSMLAYINSEILKTKHTYINFKDMETRQTKQYLKRLPIWGNSPNMRQRQKLEDLLKYVEIQ